MKRGEYRFNLFIFSSNLVYGGASMKSHFNNTIAAFFLWMTCAALPQAPLLDSGPLPTRNPLSPQEALNAFQIDDRFQVELVACEPRIMDPVAMVFDEKGRLFVVEMRGYSERRQERIGRVSRLEDRDHDGFFEHSTVFADGLSWPTAIQCWKDGILIGSTPDILYLRDRDDDGVADSREVILTGFGSDTQRLNVQQLMNSFRWTIDNRIHGANGGNPGTVFSPIHEDMESITLRRDDFSLDPLTWLVRRETGGGQHGMSFDAYGRKFACSNSHHLQMIVYDDVFRMPQTQLHLPPALVDIAVDGPAAPVFRISPDEPWRLVRTAWRVQGLVPGPVEGGGRPSGYFTAATGIQIYKGHAWPETFKGQVFIADCGSNLVHRKKLKPNGVEFVGSRVVEDEKIEFLASTDNWFRPVQIENGPDGHLYILDMYRETIEHPWSLPPGLKEHVDLNRGNDRGRIYRIKPRHPAGITRPDPLVLPRDTKDWVAFLSHPNGWHRETASRVLYQAQDRQVIPQIESLFNQSENPLARIHALHVLNGLKALKRNHLYIAVNDPHPEVRLQGIKLFGPGRSEMKADARAQEWILNLLTDPNPEVVFHALLAMHWFDNTGQDLESKILLALQNHGADRWVRTAVFTHLNVFGIENLDEQWNSSRLASKPWFPSFFSTWMSSIATQLTEQEKTTALRFTQSLQDADLRMRTATGLVKAMAMQDIPEDLLPYVRTLNRKAKEDLESEMAEIERKVIAVEWLGSGVHSDNDNYLLDHLIKADSSSVQLAVFDQLTAGPGNKGLEPVVSWWTRLSIPVRQRAIRNALQSTAGIEILLNALESGLVMPSEIPAEIKSRLRQYPDTALRRRAISSLGQSLTSNREDVIKKYQPALELTGNPENGQPIFTQRCSQCHRMNNEGFSFGPDLASAIRNGGPVLLGQILDPNREINAAYIGYEIELEDGRLISGLISSENDQFMTIQIPGGESERIDRSKITRLQAVTTSPMPEGLEEGLTVQDMADLLAFLLDDPR